MFGRKLEEVCPATSPRVPDFVVACVKEIESNEDNMCTDGLYRASGNLSQVQKIRLEVRVFAYYSLVYPFVCLQKLASSILTNYC